MARNPENWLGQELAAGRYKVTAKLGEGGMGFIYKAHDGNLDTDVVIKVPRLSMLVERQFAQRFTRELRSLVNLSHPHIVKIIDVGQQDKIPFAVMQYLSGGDLADRLQDGRVSPDSLSAWLPEIAGALDFVHEEGYVHRDIKPGNILFDKQGPRLPFRLRRGQGRQRGSGQQTVAGPDRHRHGYRDPGLHAAGDAAGPVGGRPRRSVCPGGGGLRSAERQPAVCRRHGSRMCDFDEYHHARTAVRSGCGDTVGVVSHGAARPFNAAAGTF